MQKDHIKTYYGTFTGTSVVCEDNTVVKCRTYASNYNTIINKKGFFNINFEFEDFYGGTIIGYILDN